jgi:hypothetical protein
MIGGVVARQPGLDRCCDQPSRSSPVTTARNVGDGAALRAFSARAGRGVRGRRSGNVNFTRTAGILSYRTS